MTLNITSDLLTWSNSDADISDLQQPNQQRRTLVPDVSPGIVPSKEQAQVRPHATRLWSMRQASPREPVPISSKPLNPGTAVSAVQFHLRLTIYEKRTPQSYQPISPGILSPTPTPNPATASRPTPTVDVRASNARHSSTSGTNHQRPRATSAEPPAAPHRAASAPAPDFRQDAIVTASPDFVGLTNYSSIFTEALGKLDGIFPELDVEFRHNVSIPHARVIQSCEALSFLKDKHLINQFVTRYYETTKVNWQPALQWIVKEWLNRLWIYHGDALMSQQPDKIRRLVELIWRNTQIPLQFQKDIKPIDWVRLGTGFNVRWEVIGIIAAIVGISASSIDPFDPLLRDNKLTRTGVANKMAEVSTMCLGFCRDCESMEDMFLWLLFTDTDLVGILKGDRSYHSYRAAGEMLSAIISMGLHQKLPATTTARLPLFLLEMRRRVSLMSYAVEMSLASFLGRPPRISYRHCTRDQILDLTDAELALHGTDLEAALANLDENGFNRGVRLDGITWLKAYMPFADQREDVLDLALTDYSREEILQRAEAIEAKGRAHWASMPAWLASARDEVPDPHNMEPRAMLCRSSLRQASRSNDMLLQRVVVRKAGAGSERLVAVARLIFGDVLIITQRPDIAGTFQIHFAALLVSHGLRCAAIIAVELLRQEQRMMQMVAAGAGAGGAGPEMHLLPRSKTIQDLAVFAARLGTVDPIDGSYAMCQQGQKVITKLLDRILEPPSLMVPGGGAAETLCLEPHVDPQLRVTSGLHAGGAAEPFDPSLDLQGIIINEPGGHNLFGGAPLNLGNDDDFMSWLENMDWEQADAWTAF
ncbi:uncharacterized protein E0L32_005248 [Thyridium curvatum]|uniref:Transcription factor domain-containing protein n=1 Tax=Thyridium curvatum TaxID=1093900 RepID=A0A507B631_9PEZI|nr:uncharacterized protein E0L32_005248 [Thyridium curvatum]TPX14556.1 hypothetical protein E0L32_005248 [Thyridium curvatum]